MQKLSAHWLFKVIPVQITFLMRLFFFLSLLTLLAGGDFFSAYGQTVIYPPNWFFPQPVGLRSRPGEFLIQFKPGTNPNQMAALSQRYGLNLISHSLYSGVQRVAATANIQGDLLQVLKFEPSVAYVEANFIRRIEEFVPNDPLLAFQWHLRINDLPLAWDLSTGQGVIVAVLDTGIAYENYLKFALAPDLANTSFVPGWDFINNDGHPDDDNRHGTHIAGILAQSTNNLTGGAGVAFQCTLMPVKVLDSSGSGDVSGIIDGIYYAVNNGAKIINMSFGSIVDPSVPEEEAINYAIDNGVIVICSAGNEASNQPHYPSSYPKAMAVSATRLDNQFAASYSNYGPDIDIAAPGGDLSLDQDADGSPDGIYQQTHNGSNFKNFDFYYAEGTSSACAYASGVAALVTARGQGKLSVAQVRDILQTTSIDLGLPGWDEQYGWGVVNPYAALLATDALLNPSRAAAGQGYLLPFSLLPQSLLLTQSLLSQSLLSPAQPLISNSYRPELLAMSVAPRLDPISLLTASPLINNMINNTQPLTGINQGLSLSRTAGNNGGFYYPSSITQNRSYYLPNISANFINPGLLTNSSSNFNLFYTSGITTNSFYTQNGQTSPLQSVNYLYLPWLW